MPTTRREFMAGAALAGVLPPSVGAAALLRDDAAPAAARRVLRVGHLTDVHVQPERGAKQGFAAALGRSLSLDDPIEFLLTGGDAIMDAFAADEMRTRTQWDLWQAVLRDHPVPAAHCIGNHDIWGWNRSGSSTTGDEARWGKAWAIDELELPARHYSFDRAGWHFVVLDSVRPKGEGYLAFLDEAQHEWLEADLAAAGTTPVLVLSHVPILTVTPQLYDDHRVVDDEHRIPGSWMHLDTRRLVALFARHPNVKLCLSGHMHLVDRVEYGGVTYVCGGAVSGNWWKGDLHECDEGYGVVDLYDDGTFAYRYESYGWTPRA